MVNEIAKLCILLAILFVVGALLINNTKLGKRLWIRTKGAADEMMIQDASTPEGAAAYYNSAIEAKTDNYTKAVAMLGQMTGKVKTYEQQLRDYKKKKMQYDIDIKRFIDAGDDEAAKVCIRKQTEVDDKIQILKNSVAELQSNIAIQQENVDILKEELESLKAEKEKTILELETSRTVQALKIDNNLATTEEDKMLEKVRDGVQKAKEAATGHKIAYENSDTVQQKRLDQRTRDADIEAKLQELKKAAKK